MVCTQSEPLPITTEDFDGTPLEVYSLYHKTYVDAELNEHAKGDPFYWNFLEMEFDPRPADPPIGLRVRNLIDAPNDAPRGGGVLETSAASTGRRPSCSLPEIKTLANADVRFSTAEGKTARATRSDRDGAVPVSGLVDVPAGTKVIVTAFDGTKSESQVVATTQV